MSRRIERSQTVGIIIGEPIVLGSDRLNAKEQARYCNSDDEEGEEREGTLNFPAN